MFIYRILYLYFMVMVPPIWEILITQDNVWSLTDVEIELVQKESKRRLFDGLNNKSESPRKALEMERKTAAIAELDRLRMKTDENVEKINAIQFLDDRILIGNTPWAYENMTWGVWVFQSKTQRRYYDFSQRQTEAKNQGLTLPEEKDFEDTLKSLPWEFKKDWYNWWNLLSIILWEGMSGYCNSHGRLFDNGESGSLASVSGNTNPKYGGSPLFWFNEFEGAILDGRKNHKIVCRPLVK